MTQSISSSSGSPKEGAQPSGHNPLVEPAIKHIPPNIPLPATPYGHQSGRQLVLASPNHTEPADLSPGLIGQDAAVQNYHRHPLFRDLLLEEAIQRGLAVPADDQHEAKFRSEFAILGEKVPGDAKGIIANANRQTGKDDKAFKTVRAAQSLNRLNERFPHTSGNLQNQSFTSPSSTQSPLPENSNGRKNSVSSPALSSSFTEPKDKSSHNLSKFPEKAKTGLRKSLSLSSMREPNSFNSANVEYSEDQPMRPRCVRQNDQETRSETMQELRVRLGLRADVPIPAPLRTRKTASTPTLTPIDECDDINTEDSPTLPAPNFQPRPKPLYEPHSQVNPQLATLNRHPPTTLLGTRLSPEHTTLLSNTSLHLSRVSPELTPPSPHHPQPENLFDPSPSRNIDHHIQFVSDGTSVIYYQDQGIPQRAILQSPLDAVITNANAQIAQLNRRLYPASRREDEMSRPTSAHLPQPTLPPNRPPPPPLQRRPHQPGASAQSYPAVVIRDFSLPSSPPVALAARFFGDEEDNNNDNDDDGSTGGWLAQNQQQQQRAVAPLFSAAATTTGPGPRPSDSLFLANAELARMAAKAEASDEGSDSAPAAAPVGSGGGGGGDGVVPTAGPAGGVSAAAGALGERLPGTSFLERLGKAFTKKPSFWKERKEKK
ncbi:hypothetical protein F5Y19DRAFT_492732 [Xylariaceae sp. FL1651]|nr:hypothetical protein F5Y19DRAFT_492732 [Xylariaceae sp. FL1651]